MYCLIMAIHLDTLPTDPTVLTEMVLALDAENEQLRAVVQTLKDMIFGARSERLVAVADEQLALELNDLETGVTPPPAANDDKPTRMSAKTRKKATRNIGALPKHLPRCEQVVEPETTVCPCCQGQLHKIGEDINEVLDVIPAILRVLRIIRPKYGCRSCTDGVVQAKASPRLIESGMVSTALVAYVLASKFAWYLPLYRQVQILAGLGVHLDRSTLALWVKRAAWWLKSLYELQLRTIHASPRIFCDETPMPVIDPGRRRTRTCQFWAHATDDRPWGGPAPPAVAYVFADGRGTAKIAPQLAGFSGILQVDGYSAYAALTNPARDGGAVTLAFCWAHLRRRFYEVYVGGHAPIATEALARIKLLYDIEAEIRGLPPEMRKAVRQEKSKPVIDDMKLWFEVTLAKVSKGGRIADAIRYGLNHWDGLVRFLGDGRIEIDSNTVERSIRSIVLDRKNSLFAGHDLGAEGWAMISSLLETAKLNRVNPQAWLTDVLTKLVNLWPASRIDELMPWAYAKKPS